MFIVGIFLVLCAIAVPFVIASFAGPIWLMALAFVILGTAGIGTIVESD